MNIALIFAGGTGQRMNSKDVPKQFLEIDNKPILMHTIEKFNEHEKVDIIIVVILDDWIEKTRSLVNKYEFQKVRAVIAGGKTAQESQMNGLKKIKEMKLVDKNPIVLIHDGVRPLIDKDTITKNILTTTRLGNSITVTRAIETIIYIDENEKLDKVLDRSLCRMAKAPQCFYFDEIYNCHMKSLKDKLTFIDSASMMKHFGYSLNTTEGNIENIKITTPSDYYVFKTLYNLIEYNFDKKVGDNLNKLNYEIDLICQELKSKLSIMSGKSVMITGASGLIGSLLLRLFVAYNNRNKYKIKIILPLRNDMKVCKMFTKEQFKYIDIINIEDISIPFNYSEKIDYIIHTACPTSSKYFINHPIETIDSIVLGTRNILRLAYDKNVKSIVYLSSMEVYGQVQLEQNPITEDKLGFIKLNDVRSSYSEGKRLAELLCYSFYKQNNTKVKIARLAQTFGIGVNYNDNRVFMQFVRSALNEQNIVLHTTGKSIGNYVATTDAVQALIYILLEGKSGEAYNVCNEKISMSIFDMAKLVSTKFTNNKIKVVTEVPSESTGYAPMTLMVLSPSKLHQLGWQPTKGLEDMYQELFDSMKDYIVKEKANDK